MSSPVSLPLFVGPVELMLLGAVILVLIFGSKASDIARDAGSTAGKVNNKRRAARDELDDVRGDLEAGVEPVKQEVEAVEQEVQAVERDIEAVEKDIEADNRNSGDGDTASGERADRDQPE